MSQKTKATLRFKSDDGTREEELEYTGKTYDSVIEEDEERGEGFDKYRVNYHRTLRQITFNHE
jgi:hypothetical protein